MKRMYLRLLAIAMLLMPATLKAVAQKEFYGVQSNGGETWTYYYDTQKASRGGTADPGDGLVISTTVVTVVFDASVADYKPKSMTGWFSNCSELTTITGMQYLNTSNVWLMNMMFMGCSKLKSIDLSHFDTSNVTTMVAMFTGCSGLTKLDLTSFDTSNVTNMEGMFAYCSSLTSVDLSSFNTEKVTDMSGMFAYCEDLKTVYADDARWTTAAVTNGSDVFYYCGPLVGGNGTSYYDLFIDDVSYARVDKAGQPGYFTQKDGPAIATPEPYAVFDNGTLTFYYDGNKTSRGGYDIKPFEYHDTQIKAIWGGNASKITTVNFDASFAKCTSITSTAYWFFECTKLTVINGIENLNTSNVTDMCYMFGYCRKLENLDLSSWDTGKVEDMANMFYRCVGLKTLDVSHFDTRNVQYMGYLFSDCQSVTTLDVSNFNTAKVTGMYNMFQGCKSVTALDVSGFETGNVVDMADMFENCAIPTVIDVSHFDTRNVTDMSGMFSGCKNVKNLDVGHFVTSKVTNMVRMFSGCSCLESLDVSGFDTGKVTAMYSMFFSCSGLKSLDVSHFTTSYVNDTYAMFSGCSSLTTLDLSHFDTRNVKDMRYMFNGCSNLQTIYCNDTWDAEVSSSDMFSGCTMLTGFNEEHITAAYAKPIADGGYFTPTEGGGSALPDPEPYAAISSDKKTLTFYYDSNKAVRGGMDIGPFTSAFNDNCPGWYWDARYYVTTVVFDKSFADYKDVTSTAYWFNSCNMSSIEGMENLNTDNVTNMANMFYYCDNLTSIDLSKFNTEKVTNMSNMFALCTGLTHLDLSSFNTSNVTNMSNMFANINKNLTSLDLTGFDTSNVTDMSSMFWECSKLTSIDVSRFNMAKVTNMDYMFSYCSSLTDIYCNDTWNAESSKEMFSGCKQLTGFSYDNANDVTFAKPIADGGYFTPKNVVPAKCAKPEIHYANGELSFSCETEGVEYVYSYSAPAVSVPETVGGKVNLPMTYTVTVFARKEGMEDSETVTQEINAAGVRGDVDGDGKVTVTDAVSVVNIILNK